MTGYKLYYNEKTQKFDLHKFNLRDPYNFDDDPETNLYGESHGHFEHAECALDAVHAMNQDLEDGWLQIRRCKDCGIYFTLNERERGWFTSRNFSLPRRCKSCRAERRFK